MRLGLSESSVASRFKVSPKIRTDATSDFCNNIGTFRTWRDVRPESVMRDNIRSRNTASRCGEAHSVQRSSQVCSTLGLIPVGRQALARAGWSNGDIGRIEINEALEATALAVILGRPPDIVNVEGGASARGHPIGATSDRSSPFDTSRRPQERCRRREVSCA
jgi:hypothetical protein